MNGTKALEIPMECMRDIEESFGQPGNEAHVRD